MHQVEAARLQVDAFASGIRADQDAKRLVIGIGVERLLDRLAPVDAGDAAEDRDALVGPLGVDDGLLQPPLQPPSSVLPFGKDDQATVVPATVLVEHVFGDPGAQPANPRIGPGLCALGDRQHLVDRGELDAQGL
jgi:hypothetical protein